MSAYLDASAILPALIYESGSSTLRVFLESYTEDLWISDFAAIEVASALSRLVRMGQITADRAAKTLIAFDQWRAASFKSVDLQTADVRLAEAFVRKFDLKLKAPDALHVAICHQHRFLLVTFDLRLAEAAKALDVRALVPGLT